MAEPLRLYMRVPGTSPMRELLSFLKTVEAGGFDGAGILDSQMICRDTFVTLGLAAQQTSRMQLFPAVTNPFTRHASVLAGASQTVEEIAPGRTKVIIGSGYTSASTIGRKPATLEEMRRCVSTVKTLLAGEAVDFSGKRARLGYASRRRIPVLMAASGPKAIELAAEIADGVMLLVGFNRGIVEKALGHLERGAARSGRRLEDLEVIWAARTGTATSTAEARRQARPVAVHWGFLGFGGPWLAAAGLDLPKLEIPQSVREVYPDLSHAEDWDAAIAATSFVPDEVVGRICDAIGLIGTPEDSARRIVETARFGVRDIYLMPLQSFALPMAEVRAFGDVVFPRLREAGLRAG